MPSSARSPGRRTGTSSSSPDQSSSSPPTLHVLPDEPPTPSLLPDRPPSEEEASHLQFLLRMGISSYNRLQEMDSPYQLLVASLNDVLSAVLSPEEEEA